jgi:hypothetical protein
MMGLAGASPLPLSACKWALPVIVPVTRNWRKHAQKKTGGNRLKAKYSGGAPLSAASAYVYASARKVEMLPELSCTDFEQNVKHLANSCAHAATPRLRLG